jgi:hypothetical protein
MHGVTITLALWGGIAPFVGALVAHYLTRSWQREQWLRDCRKQECHELLTALAHSHMKLSFLKIKEEILTPEEHEKIVAAMESAGIALNDRIYIAEDMKETNLYGIWNDAVNKYQNTLDLPAFNRDYKKMSGLIISIATREQPGLVRRYLNWVDRELGR